MDVILATSGDPDGEALARDVGADGFLAKPITSLAEFQHTILANLPAERQPPGLREVPDERIMPDPMAFQDDMAHIADVLSDPSDDSVLDYVAQFISGVARSAQDKTLEQAADALGKARVSGASVQQETAKLAGLVQKRLAQKIAI